MKIVEPTPQTGPDFFNSLWKTQTWLNVAYLFLSFPLGLLYFVLLITGISLGFGLLITVFGIFILMAVLVMVHRLARFEAKFTTAMLGFHIFLKPRERNTRGFWKRFREILRSSLTWKGLVFLFLRFPLGIFSFSLTIGLLSASLGLIAVPFLYRYPWFEIDWPSNHFWVIDTVPETLVVALIGVILLFTSLYILNLLAWVYGKIAQAFLSDTGVTQ